ncbi:MAG: zinc-binding dehydrogenase [Acidobacteria bacterium]|nr:zinc-binding dehydrogenase [Acidobacteriota bacterium]
MASLPRTSRAAVLSAPRQRVEIREIEILPPEAGAIVAKVEAATVCGTDVHIWEGDLQPEWPVGMGHEMVGRVAALGEGVVRDAADQPLQPGDRIVWAYPWCGKCYYCTIARQPSLCPNARMNGWRSAEKYPFLCGGFAEYCYILPQCRPVKVPDEVDSKVASSATCALRTVVHGFERLHAYGGIGVEPSVVILGTGPVGLYSLAMAIVSGAGQTISIGAPQRRIDLAHKWGATHTINLDEVTDSRERVEMVKKWTEGRGADLVIDAAGPAQAFSDGIEMIRRGGRMLVIGQATKKTVPFNPRMINHEMLEIIGVVSAHVTHFYKAMQFLKNHGERFNFSDMITNEYPLARVTEALQSMAALQEIKPAIIPTMS